MCEDCCPEPDYSKWTPENWKQAAWFAGFNSVEEWFKDLVKPGIFERLLEKPSLDADKTSTIQVKKQ